MKGKLIKKGVREMKVYMKKLATLLLAGTLIFSYAFQPSIVGAEEQNGKNEVIEPMESQQAEPQGGDENVDNGGERDGKVKPFAAPSAPAVENALVKLTQGETLIGEYDSVNKAIENVADYHYKNNKTVYKIVLQGDITEDIVIPANKNITIDLNGHKITNVSSHTIVNNSTRTKVVDSVGTGVVDNITNLKAAIYNSTNSNIELSGGTFMRSKEASKGQSDNGGNSYYVIRNYAAMTIKGNAVVKFSDDNPGYFSSLVSNGWFNYGNPDQTGEPKPNGKRANLEIKEQCTLIGGHVTLKNDDFATLTVNGGSIIQQNDGRYAVVNSSTATIKDGKIESTGVGGIAVTSIYYAPTTNDGKLTITGGTLKASDTVVQSKKDSTLDVTGGTFETTGNSSYIFDVTTPEKSKIKNGTYLGVTEERVANDKNAFVEGYGPMEGPDGNLTVDVTEEGTVAILVSTDGSEKRYASLDSALVDAKAGNKVVLQKDITLEKGVSTTNQPGITLDLNGHNIDGTAVKTAKGVVNMTVNYGWKPVEGIDSTMRVINSKATGGEIKGTLPLRFNSGNSSYEIAGEIGENVKLVTLEEDKNAVKLESSAYLVYSDTTKDYIKNGGFKATAEDGVSYIYGSHSHATKRAADGVITLLNDYTGSEKIYSGSKSAVLDLGGHTYTHTGKDNVIIDVNYKDVSLTIKNGKILSTSETASGAQLIGAPYESEMNNRTLILDNVELTVPGEVFGITTNGTETGNKVVLKDSVLNVENGYGIYFPSTGSVTIENSVINAKHVGVQMCAGDLTVTGDKTKITATGEPVEKTGGDGPIADGAAISIIERSGYKDLGKITIEDGTFKSEEGVDAIKAYMFDNTNKEQEWPDAGDIVDVNGGRFSTVVPRNLCGEKFIPTPIDPETGLSTVEKDETAPVIKLNGNAMTEGIYYGGKIKFSVEDKNLAKVTVNDEEIVAVDELYTISGAGEYTIVAEDLLGNKTTLNVVLKDEKGLISADTTKVTLSNKLVENGKEQTQLIVVVADGLTLIEGVDYEVTGNKATKAGTYKLTVTGIGNYEGSIEVEYVVDKNPVTDPSEPTDPEKPSEPTDPSDPEKPSEPTDPSDPEKPSEPTDPSDPQKPSEPTDPSDPQKPSEPTNPSEPQNPDSQEQGENDSVATGDTSNVLGYGAVMVLAGLAAIAVNRKRKDI